MSCQGSVVRSRRDRGVRRPVIGLGELVVSISATADGSRGGRRFRDDHLILLPLEHIEVSLRGYGHRSRDAPAHPAQRSRFGPGPERLGRAHGRQGPILGTTNVLSM